MEFWLVKTLFVLAVLVLVGIPSWVIWGTHSSLKAISDMNKCGVLRKKGRRCGTCDWCRDEDRLDHEFRLIQEREIHDQEYPRG